MKEFAKLLHSTNNIVIIFDEEENIKSITGIPTHLAPASKKLSTFLPSEAYGHIANLLKQAPQNDEIKRLVFPVKDDQTQKNYWFLVQALIKPLENIRILFIQDITKNKEIEIQNKKLTTAIEQSAHSVIITDPQGKIEFVNQHFLSVTGHILQDVIGNNPKQIVGSGVHDDAFFAEMWKSISETDSWRGEICNKKKSGELYWDNATISAVRDEKGEITNYISIQTDITSQKETFWELEKSKTYSEKLNRILGFALEDAKKAREESENANKAKSDFLANMSHEIRTPMNSLIGMMDLLRETNLNELQKKFLDIMDRSSTILLNLINDVLDLSRIEAGKIEINNAFFGLEEVVDTITDMMKLKAHQKGLELLIDIQTPVNLIIQSDAIRLRQIILNLVSNAVKFTDTGHVRLYVNTEKREDALHLVIEVTDTGIGIPVEKLGHLFQKFNQLSNSPEKLYGGSGLGLVITKKIVEKMNGTIHVSSTSEKGSRFAVNIPLQTFKYRQNTNNKSLRISTKNITPLHKEIIEKQIQILAPQSIITNNETCTFCQDAHCSCETPCDILIADQSLLDNSENMMSVFKKYGKTGNTKILLLLSHEQRKKFLSSPYDLTNITIFDKPLKRHELLTYLSGETTQPLEDNSTKNEDEIKKRLKLPLKILLVDDSEDNRLLMLNFLKSVPATIDVAENGISALERSRAQYYDITFMDMQMPIMDGYHSMAEIRKEDKSQGKERRYIVALSAFAFSDEIEKSYNAGCDYYVTKPIKKQKLLETILLYIKSREILGLG